MTVGKGRGRALSEEQIAQNLRDVAYAIAQQRIEGLTVSEEAQADMLEMAYGRLTIAEGIARAKARYAPAAGQDSGLKGVDDAQGAPREAG
ncbi:antitoxin VbhA family protein [Sphingobium ummariense]